MLFVHLMRRECEESNTLSSICFNELPTIQIEFNSTKTCLFTSDWKLCWTRFLEKKKYKIHRCILNVNVWQQPCLDYGSCLDLSDVFNSFIFAFHCFAILKYFVNIANDTLIWMHCVGRLLLSSPCDSFYCKIKSDKAKRVRFYIGNNGLHRLHVGKMQMGDHTQTSASHVFRMRSCLLWLRVSKRCLIRIVKR